MANTVQLQRTVVLQPTKTESLVLVKNMMTAAISAITYLRGLFPEENFKDTQIHAMPLKTIRRNVSSEANQLLDWLERGCWDALERRYLKTLIFGIYLDPTKPDELVESYSFGFSYPDNNQWCITLGAAEKETFKMKTKKEIMMATSDMLRRLLVLTQTLRPLPENSHVTMRFYYYDEVTPMDYEPPEFTRGIDPKKFRFIEKPERITLGQIETPYHGYE
ncbi:DNA-binding protein [Zopfochytrium polystomum]|nr:DNA-binding protein [Zopfochytrium polystomum]